MVDARHPSLRSALSLGTRLNGAYEIEQLVAHGSSGELYRALSLATKQTVAIKLLLAQFAANPATLALLRKEVSALANLQHEAVARTLEFAVEPVLKRPFVAGEFVEGQTLADLLKRGPMAFEAVVTLMRRLAGGFQAAHERSIVHRDIAPGNVMIPRGADVARSKIIDFGIARAQANAAQTVVGGVGGGRMTYLSPEQIGLFGGDVTAKSDIYGFGLLLFEALTGRTLDLGGNQVAMIEKRRRVPDLGAIDMRIRPLLDRMLQPDPDDRPDSMAAVAGWPLGGNPGLLRRRDADAASGNRTKDRAAAAAAAEAEAAAPERARSRRTVIVATAVGAVLAAGAAGLGYYLTLPPSAPILGKTNAPVATLGGSAAPTPAPALAPAAPPSAPPALSATTPTPPPDLAPPSAPAIPRYTPPPLAAPSGDTPQPAPPPAALLPPAGAPPQAYPQPGAQTGRPYDSVQRVEDFINQYDGGECFFIRTIAIGSAAAQIEAFGATLPPFEKLDAEFRRANGFEPDIGLRQVTASQCPAVTFLNRQRFDSANAPDITLANQTVRSGEILRGEVANRPGRQVDLLLVTDQGAVHNITALLKPGAGGGNAFSMGLQRAGPPGAQPQMLIAVASARPLIAIREAKGTPASQVFPTAAQEIAREGQSVAVSARYFKLE